MRTRGGEFGIIKDSLRVEIDGLDNMDGPVDNIGHGRDVGLYALEAGATEARLIGRENTREGEREAVLAIWR